MNLHTNPSGANGHVTGWLNAYHDGELRGSALRRVETHLEQCSECRQSLEQLRSFSHLLQENPAPLPSISTERFVAQVGLLLPREQTQPSLPRLLRAGWRWSPLLILGGWASAQVLLVITGVILLVLRLLPADNVMWAWLPASGAGFGYGLLLSLAFTIVFGLLYVSWLSLWWANHRS